MIQYKCNENYIYVHTLETEYQHIKNYFVKGVVFMMMIPRKKGTNLICSEISLKEMIFFQLEEKVQ